MPIRNRHAALRIHPWLWRTALSVLIVIPASMLVHHCWNIFMSDRIIRSEPTIDGYSRALTYDPSNASTWWRRGRLHHYSVFQADIGAAIDDYRNALERNPLLGQAWMDLSDALERAGRPGPAREALEHALEIQPYSPLIQWQGGNFFLRRGDLPRMYACFRTACRYDAAKLGIAMETAWKVDPDRGGILQKLIPDDFRSTFRYLDFLVGKNELDLSVAAWARCMKTPVPPEIDLKPSALFPLIDRILSDNRTAEALRVWDDVLRKARTGLSDSRLTQFVSPENPRRPKDLVWNGSFENGILRGGFDWRYTQESGVQFGVDTGIRLKGLKSLKVAFGGTNLPAGHLHQIVPIPDPGSYILDFYVTTSGLTTDSLPYISITGYPDAKGATARSDPFPRTTDWMRISVPFAVSQASGSIRLSLNRDPLHKLDNRIRGIVWLDGFTVRRDQSAAVLPR